MEITIFDIFCREHNIQKYKKYGDAVTSRRYLHWFAYLKSEWSAEKGIINYEILDEKHYEDFQNWIKDRFNQDEN